VIRKIFHFLLWAFTLFSLLSLILINGDETARFDFPAGEVPAIPAFKWSVGLGIVGIILTLPRDSYIQVLLRTLRHKIKNHKEKLKKDLGEF
tara:strand:- start:505 stop:780 length:276 start_codon:yes stop_codon:yes gene_type:complete